jgi:CheY-like chemotaxis protein
MAKKKILIVDDEEDFTKLIKLNLEQTGKYEVQTESQGARAVGAAKAFKPNLILLDIVMPDIDGGDVCQQLKDDKYTENIPVVFLTAVVSKEETEGGSTFIGGHLFIAKPITTSQLIDFIEKNIF